MIILINILLFIGMALVLYSGINRNLKRIISGSFLYIGYLINTPKLKGIFGWFDHSTDVILTQIIMAPFAVMLLGWLLLAVSEKRDEK